MNFWPNFTNEKRSFVSYNPRNHFQSKLLMVNVPNLSDQPVEKSSALMWNSQSHRFLLKWLDFVCKNVRDYSKCERILNLHHHSSLSRREQVWTVTQTLFSCKKWAVLGQNELFLLIVLLHETVNYPIRTTRLYFMTSWVKDSKRRTHQTGVSLLFRSGALYCRLMRGGVT